MRSVELKTWALAALILITPTYVLAAPKGAVKLPADKIYRRENFYCGQIKSSWIAGKLVSGYFYSHAAEKANIAAQSKLATGRKKKQLQSKVKSLQSLIAVRNPQCSGGPNSDPTVTPTPTITITPAGQALKFNLSDAVGLALGSASSSSFDAQGAVALNNGIGSNMRKVKSSGQMEDVVTSGAAEISKFLIAPNDKIYALLAQRTNLDDTSQHGQNDCLLAQIDKATGNPSCIDSTLSQISWQENPKNKAVQFDGSGAIYYTGYDSSNKQVLRRNMSGSITDLVNDNILLNDFLVLSDGRIILTGSTLSSNTQWIRRLSTVGGLTNLYTSTQAQFIRLFPDGNVYIGTWGNSAFGVVRYITASDAVDPQTYIVGEGLNGITYNPVFDATPFCDNGQSVTYQGFCGFYGALVKGLHRTTDNKMYAIAGYSGQGELMEYYPILARPTTVIRKVSVFQGVINNLILAGLNAQDKNVMTLFNTSNNSELELIGASNEIEIYHLNYVAADNKIMFDGLRFADNKYVIGQVDLNTMQVTASQTGSTKLQDFQTF